MSGPRKGSTVTLYGVRHHGPGSARSVRAALARAAPGHRADRGAAGGGRAGAAGGRPADAAAGGAARLRAGRAQAGGVLAVRGLLAGVAGDQVRAGRGRPGPVLRPAGRAPARDAQGRRSGSAPTRSASWPPRPATTTRNAGGRTWSSTCPAPERTAVFGALAEAIAVLRADAGPRMTRRTRSARRTCGRCCGGPSRTASSGSRSSAAPGTCPALQDLPSAAADDRLLRGLPKVKVAVTWVPWTYGRLSYSSGYGAGIRSPGWYDHLFASPGQPVERWLARAAAVLRDEGVPASSAHVIEAVRLAGALAALRGRPLAGLDEVTEATRAVLCEGSDLLVELIQRRLVVGERLGAVPPATPMVPLQRDLREQQRHLRLRPEAEPRDYDLDLRKPTDLGRSRLLHRLTLLEVAWGTPRQGRARNVGTFRESWQLTWRPELDLALIEASMWGSTVGAAATQRATSIAAGRGRPGSADGADRAVPARRPRRRPAGRAHGGPGPGRAGHRRDPPDGGPAGAGPRGQVRRRARHRPGPARRGRRRDDHPDLRRPAGRRGVPGRDGRAGHAGATSTRCTRRPGCSPTAPAATAGWSTLGRLAPRCPPLIAGRLTRLLLDAGRITADEAGLRMSRALSAAAPAPAAAGWAEGFLAGSGLLLLHDDDAAGPGRRLAGRADRRRLHRGAAGAAPDVRRVRAPGTAGDRAEGGQARRQRARARRRRGPRRRP